MPQEQEQQVCVEAVSESICRRCRLRPSVRSVARVRLSTQECTAGGGVYKVKLDASGCFSHVFWMTPLQVGLEECVPTLNGVRTSTPPAG